MSTTTYSAAALAKPASKWFSSNPDKAFVEKLFLPYLFFFFGYEALLQAKGWVNVNDFWGLVTTGIVWLPWLVVLPAVLRRNSGIAWYRSYWFKLNVYIFVLVFFETYFHTIWFFKELGMRYNFTYQHLNLDCLVCNGGNPVASRAANERIPVSIYISTMGFYTVYHTYSQVVLRRIRNIFAGMSLPARRLAWVLAVIGTAGFFAWAETFFYMQGAVSTTVWYINRSAMLHVGTVAYALFFLVSFPNIFWLDETVDRKWTVWNCVVQASFAAMWGLLLIDAWSWWHGPLAGTT
jgi:cycloeucalenol cycloisomerase